jgi:hypothetical protein
VLISKKVQNSCVKQKGIKFTEKQIFWGLRHFATKLLLGKTNLWALLEAGSMHFFKSEPNCIFYTLFKQFQIIFFSTPIRSGAIIFEE